MPNLRQIYALREAYTELTRQDRVVLDYLEKKEATQTLKKAFDADRLQTREKTRMFAFINESLNVEKPGLIKYFEENKEEDVALLFIDITSFSKTISGWSNRKIKVFLDEYYNRIIPIIYKHGGEIEKLMGDGIICVFGKPFLNLDNPHYVYKAEECAEAAIKEFHGTDLSVKVAIHKGEINYYKVPGEHYGEYTIIGQPITDLYRLESISRSNAINFYKGAPYDKLGWVNSIFNLSDVKCAMYSIENLQGVDYVNFQTIKFPNYI